MMSVGAGHADGHATQRAIRGVPGSAPPGQVSATDSTRLREAVLDHYAGLRRFLRRMDLPPHRADDVAQTAFLVALERLPRIMVGSERAFLYATAIRIAYGVRRRAQREVLGADLDLDSSPCPSPEDFAHQKRARELFDALLDCIDRESCAVFVRFEVDGLTIPEIARALAISRQAATCRLRRARKQFRALVRHLNVV
ncbi:MAG TPA: sigma-70 family RNA polymerase sigma factor [Polyangiaceae bacterium]|nr:sigma-70 family RNA polymerase sigma factor [Polyangiaceae bacterium]